MEKTLIVFLMKSKSQRKFSIEDAEEATEIHPHEIILQGPKDLEAIVPAFIAVEGEEHPWPALIMSFTRPVRPWRDQGEKLDPVPAVAYMHEDPEYLLDVLELIRKSWR